MASEKDETNVSTTEESSSPHSTKTNGCINENNDETSNKSAAATTITKTDIDEELAQSMDKKLTLEETNDKYDEEEDDEDDEESISIERLAKWLKNGTKKQILVLTGAGVSVSAGIPDFRTPGTGLYDNLQKYNLDYPEAVFDIEFYRKNPKPFVTLASELWPGLKHKPTMAHAFLALLEQHNLLLRNYTQNIDGLESLAGVSNERLMECHGHFRTASCISCSRPLLDNENGNECRRIMTREFRAPNCSYCGGYIKPDIVFFGEGLPKRYHTLVRRDLIDADLLLVMGTSLMVAPVSMIPDMVSFDCPRILINREKAGGIGDDDNCTRFRTTAVGGRGRDVVGINTWQDLFLGGDCDDIVQEICRLAGWEDELKQTFESFLTEGNGDGGGGGEEEEE